MMGRFLLKEVGKEVGYVMRIMIVLKILGLTSVSWWWITSPWFVAIAIWAAGRVAARNIKMNEETAK